MTDSLTLDLRLLNRNKTHRAKLELEHEDIAEITRVLGTEEIRKLRFDYALSAAPKGWDLNGTIGATVVQACVITGAPVTARIDETFLLKYRRMEDVTASEAEMPEDTDIEPLAEDIDLRQVISEQIALLLPDFPRSADAEFDGVQVGPPGQKAMTDEDAKPLAGLAALRAKMTDNSE